jgi:hypothetical protein
MAASDELMKLSVRAKEAEDHVAAARAKASADLQKDVDSAAADTQATAERLRQSAEANKGKVSDWWAKTQRDWNDHVAAVRADVEGKKAELDMDKAQWKADRAEDDAMVAVDYAYAAIEEAEYAVLDAALARMQADELVAASG